MKKIIFLIAISFFVMAAQSQTYQYYFLEIRSTGKMEVELSPEDGTLYPDIDSLVVSKREKNKKGYDVVQGKKYANYSAAFNVLSANGLEFVQFVSLSTVGGGTRLIGGDIISNFVIWRRKTQ